MAEKTRSQPAAKPDLSQGKMLVLLIAQAAMFAAIGVGLWSLSGREWTRFLTLSAAEVLQGVALGAGLIFVAWQTFTRFPKIADRLVRLQADTYRFLGPHLPTSAIVVISLAAGIGEEALFRAGLQVLLGDYIGPVAAIAASSAVFAAFHLGKPVITLLLFAIGLLFGTVYWLTGSLLTVMIGHVLYDIWALRYLHDSFLRLGLLETAAPDATRTEQSVTTDSA